MNLLDEVDKIKQEGYSEANAEEERILVKNIFDSTPISRSQAKKMCSSLEKFEEVVLDFEDIQWMGQGFAHQLFIVFANAHPDITITPINMSEDVTKMYQHVTVSK